MHGRVDRKSKEQEQVKSSPRKQNRVTKNQSKKNYEDREEGARFKENSITAATNHTNTSESWGTHDSGARDLDDKEMEDPTFFASPQVSNPFILNFFIHELNFLIAPNFT